MSRVFARIGELTTNDPALGDQSRAGRLTDAALVEEHGRVVWVGPSDAAPAADERVDVEGAAVVPGFVDSHTHLVFAGDRSQEFEARMAGEPYDGGGIARTVAATRAATTSSLASGAARRRPGGLRANGGGDARGHDVEPRERRRAAPRGDA